MNGRGGVNSAASGGNKGNPYASTGGKDQTDFDDLFIDWQADMNKMTTDTDLGINGAKSDAGKGWTHFLTDTGTTNLTGNDNLQRRIHGTINFEPTSDGSFPYKVRKGKEPPDPLYARIESEPVHDGAGLRADGNGGYLRNRGNNGSSIRQIIINLNVANMNDSSTDKLGYTEYSERPVFFYYTGPEKNKGNSADVIDYYDAAYNEGSHVRDSLPVIINFNARFRGIFFFPNSPVVVNGNGNDFYGYIIAPKFVMLKTYDYKEYSDKKVRGGDFLRYVAPDTKDDVYYDRSLLVEGTKPVSSHNAFQSITINGQTKYVLKSDLITDAADLIEIGGKAYRKDEAGTAEAMAYASGNGKINYYYTKRQKKNEGWTYAGTGWLDRKTAVTKNQLATFQSGWSYNNSGNDTNDSGNPEGQGVWRVKEILPNGTESDTWLDQTDEYKNRFLLKVSGALATHPPQYVYATAGELLKVIGGYTQIDSTHWKTDDAREYTPVTSNGKTYYLPKNFVLFDSDALVPEDMDGVIPVKYCDENNDEHSGCADISGDPKKYYKIYQDDPQGNDTTLNPMFVDELGNVQYRLKKNADGTDVKYDREKDPVPYETIEPTLPPTSDDVLRNRAIETAVKEMIADLPEDETAELDTREKQIAYLKEKDSETYDAKVKEYFHSYFNYLEDDNVKFFAKDDFNLNESRFDNFQLVKMTRYSYLNERETETADKRSINNFFTNEDAKRTD